MSHKDCITIEYFSPDLLSNVFEFLTASSANAVQGIAFSLLFLSLQSKIHQKADNNAIIGINDAIIGINNAIIGTFRENWEVLSIKIDKLKPRKLK